MQSSLFDFLVRRHGLRWHVAYVCAAFCFLMGLSCAEAEEVAATGSAVSSASAGKVQQKSKKEVSREKQAAERLQKEQAARQKGILTAPTDSVAGGQDVETVPASERDKVTPRNALDGAANSRWQKAYDLRVGNVILLRRSTDDPDPAGATVIMRWRSPAEIKDKRELSTKKRVERMPQKK